MAAYLIQRLGHALLVLLVVCTVTFGIIHAAPGGPALLADPKLSVAERESIARRLGVDQPLAVQYGRWIARVARGDLGRSFLYETGTLATIAERLPNTLLLAGTALLLAVVVGVPLGVAGGESPGGWVDRLSNGAALVALSVPVFWLGIVAILVFAVMAGALPAGGAETVGGGGGLLDRLRHLVLPAVVLSAAGCAELLRYTRASTRRQFRQGYVRTARAKGASARRVRWRHAVRNACIPLVTVVGLQLPRLVGGAAITETVFSWPGMGRLGIEAALARDYPLVMGITLVVSVGVLLASLLVDLAYFALDPRIRPGQ